MTGDAGPTADGDAATGPGDATSEGNAGTGGVGSDDESTDAAVGPSPDLGPADAVRAQLDALAAAAVDVAAARADGAVPASVRTLFDFSAPAYRTAHGSLDGFATTLLGPIYDRLLGAYAVERGPTEREGETFTQAVLVRHPDGERTYEFTVARQSDGKYAGCWMTTAIDLVYDGRSPTFRRTPTVRFEDREVTCEVGDQLRSVLLAAEGNSPHNDVTQVANCGGNGLCGTCAVAVDGEVSQAESRERRRLDLPPHDEESGLRLACQIRVQGDVTVSKHRGLWGQHVEEVATDDGSEASDDDPPDPIPVTDAEYAGTYDYVALAGGDAR
ncbi:2Fe-2S iron-sulfur cluster-binding protein [Haloarchaeobius litoreus]|uniref:2Fe-2S iron-sulfur cluster-binding protein n=1 Tax=Haloarchaeobius litoreus TaxID=755306 RepID=A0ABD6DPP3_9EURY|nr:2Fe-2S iron-sulfur cluster-binding protein [Haloarchaeobius litoreus]